MQSFCKFLHPATAVEHAIYCHFFSHLEKNLVVAGANVIRVFRLVHEGAPGIDAQSKDDSSKQKLECMATYELFGNVTTINRVSLTGSSRDSLLISFMDAKLSVVEYDPSTHDLRTLSLHYFEEDEMKNGWTHNCHIPEVRVDPEHRCAVMIVYGRKIVVLPFKRDQSLDTFEMYGATQSPLLASYMIAIKEIDEKMDNVIDMQFLHGYYEPTLLILFEPLKTCPGRIAVRNDTCAMVAISLNIQQKVHPVIWSVGGLPFDCTRVCAVPKPIGGTLIFAVNSLLYLNQSIPPFGVSLNSIAEASSNFPLKPQEGVSLALDCAQATFISNERLVISLKGGELYVLTFHIDSMRSIRGFVFQKAAASVLTTCVCICDDGYLFLGSRLGNSLLLKYTEKPLGEASAPQPTTQQPGPASKKQRLNDLSDWMASDVGEIQDLDLQVYGADDQSSVQLSNYTFEVCDSLLNIGPCGYICMGEPAFLSEELASEVLPDLELVTTSGYGKNGALCVLQRSVRPQVVTTFELPGCIDMWTIVGKGDSRMPESSHAYLIISKENSTMVLQTGQEINELDSSGFNTNASTIFAGNIGNNRFGIQVTSTEVRLMDRNQQRQSISLDGQVISASLSDPYLVLLCKDGRILLFTFQNHRLTQSRPNIALKAPIRFISCYRDSSGLFTTSGPFDVDESEEPRDPVKPMAKSLRDFDDEDDLLYGDSDITILASGMTPAGMKPKDAPVAPPKVRTDLSKPTFWLIAVRENGILEIYSLPDMKVKWSARNFPVGAKVLSEASIHSESTKVVEELLMVGLGRKGSRPVLFAFVSGELLIYEAYPYLENTLSSQLKIRFKKLKHEVIQKDSPEEDEFEEHGPRLKYFNNIAGYSGVFVCGDPPYWVILTSRGDLRTHPMGIDGEVNYFAPFHNVNCPLGFLYFNNKDELRFCVLPTHVTYDFPWAVRKVPLRATPRFITYHVDSKTYCVITSYSEASNTIYKFNGEDKELSVEERDERFVFPQVEKFQIQLFSPVSWEVIPNTVMVCDDWEHVTCMKAINLSSEGTLSGLKGYVAIGTNYNYGEDITSRGRIILLDIIEVVPEPGQPLTKNKFKTLYSKDQKGPITALCSVKGFLVTSVGQKVYVWQLKDDDLVGIAFLDVQVYIHEMISCKDLIFVADMYKSVSLLRFQDEFRTLSLITRDFKAMEVYTIDFMVEERQLGFLATDVEKNLTLFMYQPESRESQGGLRLLRKCDLHMGQHVNTMFRIRTTSNPNVHVNYFATLDGALGYVLPLTEKTYKRMLMLQNALNSYLPHLAGLNPKEQRTIKTSTKFVGNPQRGILEGNLIWKFRHLSSTERSEVARKIGHRVSEILKDLKNIYFDTLHF